MLVGGVAGRCVNGERRVHDDLGGARCILRRDHKRCAFATEPSVFDHLGTATAASGKLR
jgi:hypothetical protein